MFQTRSCRTGLVDEATCMVRCGVQSWRWGALLSLKKHVKAMIYVVGEKVARLSVEEWEGKGSWLINTQA